MTRLLASPGSPPVDVLELRRGAHRFLRRFAAAAWAHCHNGQRWDVVIPPELMTLTESHRYQAHARGEARRLAEAHVYDVCPELTRRAARTGAAIHAEHHAQAMDLTGCGTVVDTLGIQPPTSTGFLRWRDVHGIGSNEVGAPIIACHWGPAAGGYWLAWWSDNYVVARSYTTGEPADGPAGGNPFARPTTAQFLSIFGPLWYDHQELLRPHVQDGAGRSHGGAGAAGGGGDGGDGRADASVLALVYTTLATWLLLRPDAPGVHLTRRAASAAVRRADRTAGLSVRPVTVASIAESS